MRYEWSWRTWWLTGPVDWEKSQMVSNICIALVHWVTSCLSGYTYTQRQKTRTIFFLWKFEWDSLLAYVGCDVRWSVVSPFFNHSSDPRHPLNCWVQSNCTVIPHCGSCSIIVEIVQVYHTKPPLYLRPLSYVPSHFPLSPSRYPIPHFLYLYFNKLCERIKCFAVLKYWLM